MAEDLAQTTAGKRADGGIGFKHAPCREKDRHPAADGKLPLCLRYKDVRQKAREGVNGSRPSRLLVGTRQRGRIEERMKGEGRRERNTRGKTGGGGSEREGRVCVCVLCRERRATRQERRREQDMCTSGDGDEEAIWESGRKDEWNEGRAVHHSTTAHCKNTRNMRPYRTAILT